MRVISKKALREFWERQADSEGQLKIGNHSEYDKIDADNF
jgi:mRNA-degrading endonuclease HigB of HigAB toxin-antitoxin module